LTTGIKWLHKWWSEYFTLTGPGLSTKAYTDFTYLKDNLTLRALIDKHESDEDGDYIKDFEAFINLLESGKLGTRDTSAELFVAILRSCGLDTRLVCSLQPLPYKIPPAPAQSLSDTEQEKKEGEEEEEKTKVRFKFRANSKTYVDPNKQLKEPRAKPPTVWAEVYCTETLKWICIDPIRGHMDKPALIEPAALNRSNHVSFILAFDGVNNKGRGNVTDVTRRYTSNLEKAIRLRERPLTKREKEGGMNLWSETFLNNLYKRNKLGEREKIEQQELDTQESNEVMPTAMGNFKNHPLYVLERHLKKFEILHPKEPVLGSIRGEKIYPRQCVKNVSTADTYRKLGREIIEGEQPAKMVKANAVTIEKRRLKEQAKQEGHDLMVACYGDWQTKVYVPPPVKNVSLLLCVCT
jgi:xeroderma pigmentosum group C-complementing protein